MKFTSS